jgi:hypothetical protein
MPMSRYWFTIYDYEKPGWSWPRQMDTFEANNELIMAKHRKSPTAPNPILARWRQTPTGGMWEYQPGMGKPYIPFG